MLESVYLKHIQQWSARSPSTHLEGVSRAQPPGVNQRRPLEQSYIRQVGYPLNPLPLTPPGITSQPLDVSYTGQSITTWCQHLNIILQPPWTSREEALHMTRQSPWGGVINNDMWDVLGKKELRTNRTNKTNRTNRANRTNRTNRLERSFRVTCLYVFNITYIMNLSEKEYFGLSKIITWVYTTHIRQICPQEEFFLFHFGH